MRIIKLPLKKKYCKKCKKELPNDWMYDECKDCMLDNQKITKIIKGAVIGGLILSIGTALYQTKKYISKGND